MNITKEQADKVIAALEIAKATLIEYGDWWPVGEPIAIVDCAEALSIMRGLAEDAEPPPGWKLVPIEPTDAMWDAGYDLDYCSAPGKVWADMMAVIPSPQAAQTAVKSESLAQAAQAPARLPGEGKTIEALAPIQAAQTDEREAFEAWLKSEYLQTTREPDSWGRMRYTQSIECMWKGYQAGRAGRKG